VSLHVAQQVWSIRCDVHVLDHGGNIIDAASVAILAALLHFRHADVTVTGICVCREFRCTHCSSFTAVAVCGCGGGCRGCGGCGGCGRYVAVAVCL
jgi:hypothetical protein